MKEISPGKGAKQASIQNIYIYIQRIYVCFSIFLRSLDIFSEVILMGMLGSYSYYMDHMVVKERG